MKAVARKLKSLQGDRKLLRDSQQRAYMPLVAIFGDFNWIGDGDDKFYPVELHSAWQDGKWVARSKTGASRLEEIKRTFTATQQEGGGGSLAAAVSPPSNPAAMETGAEASAARVAPSAEDEYRRWQQEQQQQVDPLADDEEGGGEEGEDFERHAREARLHLQQLNHQLEQQRLRQEGAAQQRSGRRTARATLRGEEADLSSSAPSSEDEGVEEDDNTVGERAAQPQVRPAYGKESRKELAAFRELFGKGLEEYKPNGFTFRHRAQGYLARLDRWYLREETEKDTCRTEKDSTWDAWISGVPKIVSTQVSDHQPSGLRPRLIHKRAASNGHRAPTWAVQHPQYTGRTVYYLIWQYAQAGQGLFTQLGWEELGRHLGLPGLEPKELVSRGRFGAFLAMRKLPAEWQETEREPLHPTVLQNPELLWQRIHRAQDQAVAELRVKLKRGELYGADDQPAVAVQLYVVEEVLKGLSANRIDGTAWHRWIALFPGLQQFAQWKLSQAASELACLTSDKDALIELREDLFTRQREDWEVPAAKQWGKRGPAAKKKPRTRHAAGEGDPWGEEEREEEEQEEQGHAEDEEEEGKWTQGWWLPSEEQWRPRRREEPEARGEFGVKQRGDKQTPLDLLWTKDETLTDEPDQVAKEMIDFTQTVWKADTVDDNVGLDAWCERSPLRVQQGELDLDLSRIGAYNVAKKGGKSCPGPDGKCHPGYSRIAGLVAGTLVATGQALQQVDYEEVEGLDAKKKYVAQDLYTEINAARQKHGALQDSDVYGLGKKPLGATATGRTIHVAEKVRYIQVGQIRRRAVVRLLHRCVEKTYRRLLGPHQAAWVQKRLGVRNILQFNYAMRYWQAQRNWESIGGLIDLAECFPKTKRKAVRRLKKNIGFPETWLFICDNLYKDPRVFFIVKGRAFVGGRMWDGLEQGCTLSTVDLPLCLELFIQELFTRIRSKQLRCQLWAFADDLAFVAAIPRRGPRLDTKNPPLEGPMESTGVQHVGPVVSAGRRLRRKQQSRDFYAGEQEEE